MFQRPLKELAGNLIRRRFEMLKSLFDLWDNLWQSISCNLEGLPEWLGFFIVMFILLGIMIVVMVICSTEKRRKKDD